MLRPAALAALSLATLACAEPDARNDASTLPALRLAVSPLLEIGVVEGDNRYAFQDVTGVLPLSAGGVVVADGGAGELTRYAADGTFVHRWGGRGEGPGEFYLLSRVYPWAGDSIAALDQRIDRLSLFDADGAFGRRIDPRDLSQDTLFTMDVWLHGRFWVDGAVDAAARDRVRAALDRLPPPLDPPGYRFVRVAVDGRMWIREPGARDAGTRAWTVLDPSGTPSAVVDLPTRLDPQHLGVDRVVGRWRGENDVNFVRMYMVEDADGTRQAPAWLSDPVVGPTVEAPVEAEFLALIRSSLQRMAAAQEIHYASHGTYTAETDALAWERPEGLVADVVGAGTRGWTVVFTHPGLDRLCGLGYGSAVPPGWRPGAIVCGPAAGADGAAGER
jgi:hypothetical protein